jgi:acyl-CoA-binding protein
MNLGNIGNLFEHYCEVMKGYPNKGQDKQLVFYSLYKQAVVGDAPIIPPSMFFPVSRRRWSSWSELRGMSKCDAMSGYIVLSMRFLD